MRNRQRVSKRFKIPKGPDHLLAAGHFQDLRIGLARMTIADQIISIGENLNRRHPSECDSGQIILFNFQIFEEILS